MTIVPLDLTLSTNFQVMIEHAPDAWNASTFTDVISKVGNMTTMYKAIDFYIAEHPELVNDLLYVLAPKCEATSAMNRLRAAMPELGELGMLPLCKGEAQRFGEMGRGTVELRWKPPQSYFLSLGRNSTQFVCLTCCCFVCTSGTPQVSYEKCKNETLLRSTRRSTTFSSWKKTSKNFVRAPITSVTLNTSSWLGNWKHTQSWSSEELVWSCTSESESMSKRLICVRKKGT